MKKYYKVLLWSVCLMVTVMSVGCGQSPVDKMNQEMNEELRRSQAAYDKAQADYNSLPKATMPSFPLTQLEQMSFTSTKFHLSIIYRISLMDLESDILALEKLTDITSFLNQAKDLKATGEKIISLQATEDSEEWAIENKNTMDVLTKLIQLCEESLQ